MTAARLAERPFAVGHVGLVAIELTEVADHRVAHVLRHLHRHARVVQADHRHAGWQLELHQGIDTGTGVEDGFQARLLVQHLLRGLPDHCVVCRRRTRLPEGDLGAGNGGLQPGNPAGLVEIGRVIGNAHRCCHARIFTAVRATFAQAGTTMRSNSLPSVTWSPGANKSSPTVPSAGAAIVCSIFMASITARA